jgi:hypothetical protein
LGVPPARSILARARDALGTPRALAVLLALAAADVAGVAWGLGRSSLGGAWVRATVRDPVPRRGEHVATIFAVREPDGSLSIMDESQSADRLARLSQNEPERVLSISYWDSRWMSGAWFPWSRGDYSEVTMFDLSTGTPPPDEREQRLARQGLAQWLEARGATDLAARARAGDHRRLGAVWWGPPMDVATLLLAGACLYSLGRNAARIPTLTRRGKLRRGICPGCGYDLRGAAGGAGATRCPECGREWVMPG